MWYESLINYHLFPDRVLRLLVRLALKKYVTNVSSLNLSEIKSIKQSFIAKSSVDDIAKNTISANNQHYEFPTYFFENILSSNMKYSGSVWDQCGMDIESSDSKTLDLYLQRSGVRNGDSILELGSGWGSLTFRLASKLNNSRIVSVTNSKTQYEYIFQKAISMKLNNVKVIKEDINQFDPKTQFNYIFSIEMLEHIRNTQMLMKRIYDWITPGGYLFIQVFSHAKYPQFFDDITNSWMAKNFFTGGMMPFDGYFSEISGDFNLKNIWRESGINYHKTLEHWLISLINARPEILSESNNSSEIRIQLNRFRFFLIFCSELFKYNQGKEWYLMNYLFQR